VQSGIENPGYFAFFDALIEGRLQLGQTITQENLCAVLGVSLSPLREITTLLQAEGLIDVRRKVGITIFYPDVRFVGNTFQLRGLLEREGLRKFSRTVTAPWIEKTRTDHHAIIDYVRTVNDQRIYRVPIKALEAQFHESFINAYANDQINVIYARLIQKMYLIRLHNLEAVNTTNTVQAMQEHLAIVDALEQGDEDAAVEALERHFKGVLHRTLMP